jgi:hypothetical protein
MVDTKLILDSNDSSLEWRTFCCCREGAVIQGKFFDITSLSGSSNKSSNKSNVGFILRLNSGTLFHSHLDEIASVLQGKLPVFKCSFSDFMADTQGHFLGPWISSTLREGLKVLTDKYDLHDATLSGPCLEGVGYYPKLSSNLETDVPGLFVAGDSTGHFRGLLSAILSGYYAVKQANKRRHSSETILASSVQIKGSQTDRMHQIFTAQSKKFFYCRDAICEYVLKCGKLPINPFRVFDYFLSDRVSRDVIRNGNNQLIRASDELWVFGPISDGVLFEIVYAMNLGMPLKFFTMGTRASEIALVDNINDLTFEPEIHFTGIKKTTLLKQIEDAFLQSKSNSLQLTLGL